MINMCESNNNDNDNGNVMYNEIYYKYHNRL